MDLVNKKIGIWGFGVVGKSALAYCDQYQVTSIEILDVKEINIPATVHPIATIIQTPANLEQFLQDNDIILVSPGIALHDYQKFAHKFISELDLYQQHATWPTIAVTGSLGKTSITHLLNSILQKMSIHTMAAGNIGHAMLNLIRQPITNYDAVILEVSSFQLQQAQRFAPDLAIITNLHENHLDHHKTMQEYVTAKCNIFIHQTAQQTALLPLPIIDMITSITPAQQNWVFFSTTKPTDQELTTYKNHSFYYLAEQKIYHRHQLQTKFIFDLAQLPAITFDENWLIIIAALHVRNIDLTQLTAIAEHLEIPDHRLQKIKSWHGSHFYNDSKSTVWQATLQAVLSIEKSSSLPIKLFVGGLDKGVDRTPLFLALADKSVEIFAFGKEAEQIEKLCKQYQITYQTHPNLDESFAACIATLTTPCNILFSPGGSSFDLFADYKARGQYFTALVKNL